MRKRFILPLLGVFLLAAGCRQASSDSGATGTAQESTQANSEAAAPAGALMNPADFDQLLRQTTGAVVLDVRTPEEYRTGYIAGAENLDFSDAAFSDKLAALDRDKPYFIYCAAGGRSHRAFEMMQQQGFRQVYELEGGTSAWESAGMPLVH